MKLLGTDGPCLGFICGMALAALSYNTSSCALYDLCHGKQCKAKSIGIPCCFELFFWLLKC